MCLPCLSSNVDITEGISKQNTITYCSKCDRYLNGPGKWMPAQLESKELLSLCLKKVRGLSRSLKLKDAQFLYTEPHSRKLLIQVKVRGELQSGAAVEQNVLLEFQIHTQQCTDCHRVAAKDYWNAVVQVRQRTDHKKTLLYLEQILLKSHAHQNCNNIKQLHGGIDFFFANQAHAIAFVDYIGKHIPCRYQVAQQLKSHDIHSNTYNYKWTYAVEVPPICKDDLVCLPPQLAQKLGNLSQILLVYRITNKIHLIDPKTCTLAQVDVTTYYKQPFYAIANPKNFTSFYVMDVERDYRGEQPVFDDRASMMSYTSTMYGAGHGPISHKHSLVGLWLTKEQDLGRDTAIETAEMEVEVNFQKEDGEEDGGMVFVQSHLGYIVREGNFVEAFDFRNANINNAEFEKMKSSKIPDLLVIRKLRKKKTEDFVKPSQDQVQQALTQSRAWQLQRLCDKEDREDDSDEDAKCALEDFMADLENDQDMSRCFMVKQGDQLVNLHDLMEKVDLNDEEMN
ncbi:ribosome-binding protein [Cichlidogyrus casuarinus]|uniref:60S ribosomal export protein NMD3 n=1 Tax=Cichlidogyrus casuarinus TaxID=1844966 RepID=A0ABD2QM31_9PLAT